MTYSLVIFDLDGTLADSFPWFRHHVNGVADRYGFRRVADEDVESLRHAGSREILDHLEVPLWKLPLIARHMRRLKGLHISDIPLFDGAEMMLRKLADGGFRLALVSSDSEGNARKQLREAAALFSYFDCGASIFGKAAKFRRVVKRAGIKPAQAIAIGDETRDIEAARAAGIACGAVQWGFAAPQALKALAPDLMFERMEDIVRALGTATGAR
ncbi:HAD-IA family hydrolase [Bradyrhizobium sp. ARR65]|uniref:HAD-IA family hydrolase n=1 Tax=Bradyrhizobium sp. ARR65 TaxID=1040989 RepID=UPI000466763B|nr:HAD-IA family hydrolase [Bradyrhizobium sp. ARR65]